MNYLRTGILLAAMTALFMGCGYLIGGEGGMMIAFGLAAAMNLFAYWNSDKMVLRMHGARQIERDDAPGFHGIIEQLARKAELPMPKVYIMENDQPNAFATGRNPENAAVAATTGLLRLMSDQEVAGVMAHELAHVKNRDTLIMTITATIAGAISMLANIAMFSNLFGGDSRNNPLGFVGVLLDAFARRRLHGFFQLGDRFDLPDTEADQVQAHVGEHRFGREALFDSGLQLFRSIDDELANVLAGDVAVSEIQTASFCSRATM